MENKYNQLNEKHLFIQKKNSDLILDNKKLQEKNHAASLENQTLQKKNHKTFVASTVTVQELSILKNTNKNLVINIETLDKTIENQKKKNVDIDTQIQKMETAIGGHLKTIQQKKVAIDRHFDTIKIKEEAIDQNLEQIKHQKNNIDILNQQNQDFDTNFLKLHQN